MDKKVVIIACSIFKFELEHLKSEGKINVPIVYLNSMLHLNPEELEKILGQKLEEYKSYKILLLYGDCHARMVDYEKNPDIVRSPGINCCEIFLGKEKYQQLRKEGAFILLPEWSVRWREAFVEYMGFKNAKSSRLFMNDMHKKIVYVDTGFQDKNQPLLTEISEYFGLPLEIYNTSISELEKVLHSLIDTQNNNK